MQHSRLTIFVLAMTAVLVGIIWSAGAAYSFSILWSPVSIIKQSFAGSRDEGALSQYGIAPLPPTDITVDELIIPTEGKAIRIDVEHKELTLFNDGVATEKLTLASVPQYGSPWFAPTGRYAIEGLARTHTSLIAETKTDYAFFFGENSIVHADGEGVGSFGFGLPEEVAAKAFVFAEEDMPVIVLANDDTSQYPGYHTVLSSLQDRRETLSKPRADAYLLGDAGTGELLLSKDEDEALPIASVSKLMTALVARTLASESELSGAEKETLSELIYTLILRSSNVAAERIADMFGRERFMNRMNARAQEIGLTQTSFDDPSGLSPENKASARDLFRLLRYLVKTDADLLAITQLKRHERVETKYGGARLLVNHNRLVRTDNPYFVGGKTGYTPEAGQTAAALFRLPVSEHDTRTLAAVVLDSNDRGDDIAALLSSGARGTAYGIPAFTKAFSEIVNETEKGNTSETMTVAFAGSVFPTTDLTAYERLMALAGFKGRDVFALSLEGVTAQGGYNVRGDDALRNDISVLDALRTVGTDALVVSNGHAGDWGRSAFDTYIDELQRHEITPLGGGKNARQAQQLFATSKNGITVGIMAVSDAGPAWLSEEPDLPMILSKDVMVPLIKRQASRVDHLIVSVDFNPEATHEERRALAHRAIDAGAAAVVGFGEQSDTLYERYNNGAIFYGLGEFSGPGSGGVVADFVFDKDGIRDVRGGLFKETEEGIRRTSQ